MGLNQPTTAAFKHWEAVQNVGANSTSRFDLIQGRSCHAPSVERRNLKAFGHVDGKTAKIEYRWANGDYERLPSFAKELVGLHANVNSCRRGRTFGPSGTDSYRLHSDCVCYRRSRG
jgi:hypothetical protein